MRKAYVLIQAEMGSAEAVAGSLRDKPGVVAADVVTGPHDVIAIVQGVDADAVARVVINDIQTTKGVSHTTTYMAVGSNNREE